MVGKNIDKDRSKRGSMKKIIRNFIANMFRMTEKQARETYEYYRKHG